MHDLIHKKVGKQKVSCYKEKIYNWSKAYFLKQLSDFGKKMFYSFHFCF